MSWLTPQKCCLCIPLKIGCYILAVTVLLSGIGSLYGIAQLIDKNSTTNNCYPLSVNITMILLDIFISFIFGTVTALYFLYALITKEPSELPILLFMFAFGLRILVVVLSAVILPLVGKNESCQNGANFGVGTIQSRYSVLGTLFAILLNVHWLLCVNGYRKHR